MNIATNRSIKIFGIGLAKNTEIKIKIDNHIIFSGKVENNFMFDELEKKYNPQNSIVASWVANGLAFTKKMTIIVIKGKFRYTLAKTTYLGEANHTEPKLINLFSYYDDYGNTVYDPNSNIKINSKPYKNAPPKHRKNLTGQWSIDIDEGQKMTCNLHANKVFVRGLQYTVKKVHTKRKFEISISRNDSYKDTYISGGVITKENNVQLNISNLIHNTNDSTFVIETYENHNLDVEEKIFITDVNVLIKNLNTDKTHQTTLFE